MTKLPPLCPYCLHGRLRLVGFNTSVERAECMYCFMTYSASLWPRFVEARTLPLVLSRHCNGLTDYVSRERAMVGSGNAMRRAPYGLTMRAPLFTGKARRIACQVERGLWECTDRMRHDLVAWTRNHADAFRFAAFGLWPATVMRRKDLGSARQRKVDGAQIRA